MRFVAVLILSLISQSAFSGGSQDQTRGTSRFDSSGASTYGADTSAVVPPPPPVTGISSSSGTGRTPVRSGNTYITNNYYGNNGQQQQQGQGDRQSDGMQRTNTCLDTGAFNCKSLDEKSASACAAPREIVMLINAIAPMLSSGDYTHACAKMEILYATAAGLETIWATKCMNAANRCIQACTQSGQEIDRVFNGECRTSMQTANQDMDNLTCAMRDGYRRCIQRRTGPIPITGVCMLYPTNPPYVTCGCSSYDRAVNCSDGAIPSLLDDVDTRKGACQADKTRSLSAFIEAGLMGAAAIYNEKCRRETTQGGSGSPTGVTSPTGPLCDTREKRKTNPECMPFYCDEFIENMDKPECSCEIGMFYASPRCNCKHKADKNNPLCKPALGPVVPQSPLVPPIKPIPTPPPLVGVKPTPSPVPNPNRPTPTLEEDIDGGTDQEFNPAGGPGGPGQKVQDIGPGGGGGVSSLGLGAGGSGGGGGAGEGPYKTDIDKGYGNSGGGGMAGGGGGYQGGPQGGGGYGPDGEKDKIDLSAFLPKVDKARGLAGVDPDMAANGITGANGLSNWEKVTRKMNEKRPVLLP